MDKGKSMRVSYASSAIRQRNAAEPRGFSLLAQFLLLERFSRFPTHRIGFYVFLST
jgi:hypothetical protein